MSRPPLSRWAGRHAQRRRYLQIAFLALFALLPAFDLLRFDFVRSRLHLFGQEIWLDEWALLWLALMFGMWLIGAVSLLFGRVWCAYACPQMVFSELAHDVDELWKRAFRRLDPKLRERLARGASLGTLFGIAVLASVVCMGYFTPLPDAFARLLRLDVGPWVGGVGASLTLLGFLDLAFVRERFCQSVCPYGLLQGVIEDGRSLHVRFDRESGGCIDCGACARVCPMEIDIRDGSFQIECTRCGSCIDSCDTILGRLKRPGVLAFDFGGIARGGWDAKRALVALSTVGFGVVFLVAVARRQPVAFHLSPAYAESSSSEAPESRFLLRAANRGKAPVTLSVRTEGLPPSASIAGVEDPRLPAGEERRYTLVVRVPAAAVSSSVTPFTWVVQGGPRTERFSAALFAPRRKPS